MASSNGTSQPGRTRNNSQGAQKAPSPSAFSKFVHAVKEGIQSLRPHSPVELWLLVSLTGFLLLEVVFFCLAWKGHEYRLLRYVLIAANVPLILIIPEVMRRPKRWVRILLLLVPTLGAAFLQARVEDMIFRMSEQRNSSALYRMQEEAIQNHERQLTEQVVPLPNSIIQSGQLAEKGYILKGERRGVSAFFEEARLVVDQPALAAKILTFSENPRIRLGEYEQLVRTNPSLEARISPVLEALQDETTYLDLADYFRMKIKPAYERLEYKIDHKALLTTDACQQLLQIMGSLRSLVAVHPAAGLYNHIGNLALNCGEPELALASFYEALVTDKTHVTIYESLSYALWIFNNDSKNALQYADLGLRRCHADRDGVLADFQAAQQLYDNFGLHYTRYAPLVSRHVNYFEHRIMAIQNDWAGFMDRKMRHFENGFAYYSALRLENERQAKEYIDALYKESPDDPDIQDTRGFVYMRFASKEEDLNLAEQLFLSAIKNQNATPETPRLANAHLQELRAYRAALRGEDESAFRERLASLTDDSGSMLAREAGDARVQPTAGNRR